MNESRDSIVNLPLGIPNEALRPDRTFNLITNPKIKAKPFFLNSNLSSKISKDRMVAPSATALSNVFFKKFSKSKSRVSIGTITSLFSGTVISVIDGVFVIRGLRTVRSGALITFQDSDSLGLVLTLNEDNTVAAVILRGTAKPGDLVFGEKALLRFNCHFRMLGHVFDPLGEALDTGFKVKKSELKFYSNILIDTKAPGVISRQSINQPLYTGIKFVDSMVPIGRGQRELIIGDRQTGKTAIAIDTIINQKSADVLCVYTSIGQKRSSISLIANKLAKLGAMKFTIIISASASDHAALQYLAPYAGCTVGEYFRDNGLHSVVIYDDLSKQAVSYRQMALLLRRPPGREAFPGDIFYVHSRLLERGAKLSEAFLGGSLTALPIIETLAGDVSAYISTNVISITDGQIFLSSKLFLKNIRPAVDLGLSVSRVGSAAQPKLISKVGSVVKSNLAVYREIEVFSSFSSDIDATTLEYLKYGAKLIQFLQQGHSKPVSAVYQVVLLWTAVFGRTLKAIDISYVTLFSNFIISGLNCNIWIDISDLNRLDLNNLNAGRWVVLEHLSQLIFRDFNYFVFSKKIKKTYKIS